MAHDKLQKEIDRDWTRFRRSRRGTRVIPEAHDDIAERDADSDNFYRLVVGYVRAYSLSV